MPERSHLYTKPARMILRKCNTKHGSVEWTITADTNIHPSMAICIHRSMTSHHFRKILNIQVALGTLSNIFLQIHDDGQMILSRIRLQRISCRHRSHIHKIWTFMKFEYPKGVSKSSNVMVFPRTFTTDAEIEGGKR